MRSRIVPGTVLCLLVAGMFVGSAAFAVDPPPSSPCDEEYTGTSGDDVIRGNQFDNVICGRDGDDTLIGGEGDDVLKGQGGNDTLIGGEESDDLLGGLGNDVLFARGDFSDDSDFLNGGPGNDTGDWLGAQLALGAVRIAGRPVALFASLRDGYATHENATDTFVFGGGHSTVENVRGSVFADYIEGDVSANKLWGRSGDDEIHGFGGEDRLAGQGGDDDLFGEGGNDFLDGGDQSDRGDFCFGGAGTNTVVNCFP